MRIHALPEHSAPLLHLCCASAVPLRSCAHLHSGPSPIAALCALHCVRAADTAGARSCSRPVPMQILRSDANGHPAVSLTREATLKRGSMILARAQTQPRRATPRRATTRRATGSAAPSFAQPWAQPRRVIRPIITVGAAATNPASYRTTTPQSCQTQSAQTPRATTRSDARTQHR